MGSPKDSPFSTYEKETPPSTVRTLDDVVIPDMNFCISLLEDIGRMISVMEGCENLKEEVGKGYDIMENLVGNLKFPDASASGIRMKFDFLNPYSYKPLQMARTQFLLSEVLLTFHQTFVFLNHIP